MAFAPLPEEEPRTPSAGVVAAVFCGGAAGALARVALTESVRAPWATLAVNVAGALVLGALLARSRSARTRGLLGTGVCGALTTFSTLCVEALDLRPAQAVAYVAASLVAGLAAAALGRRAFA